ncbi:hypothetical protein KGM_202119 [Danaus plexippus plexippus]|uniref:Uncharacterized protein n=1 Tax=Danaus plexippus plexippus TaxID=278856 RepID=A0A212ETN5_DANPL|nr:hypothetical protein KGM_202119 [Danaus plexippus plexippus]
MENQPLRNKTKRYFDTVPEKDEKAQNKNENVKIFTVKSTAKLLKIHKYKEQNMNRRKKTFFNNNKIKKNFPSKAPIDPKKLELHSRGEGFTGQGVLHPLHLLKLKKREKKFRYAQEQAARADILLTEGQGYLEVDEDNRTTSINQKVIADNVDITAATKIFELNLEFGPYNAKYSRNGRHLLLGGKKGHLAAFDWVTKKLHFEINVMESIHDMSWLHVETMVAAAQKEWLYIYDNTGTEIHCVKKLDKILKMEFLPYHFLLATVNEYGFMSWLDISIGEIVGHYNNNMGRTSVMTQNPYNATVCLGNPKGVVSMWSPSSKKPLAKILCHKTPITAIAVDNRGMYMATSGVDRSLKIWDIRNLDGPLQHYKLRSAPVHLEFSQKEMLAVGLGNNVEVYSDCCIKTTDRPYLRHRMAKEISNFKFCPFEDVLGIGNTGGFTSIIVPGSGEPNFDALESNPFQNKKQRKEAEVKALLEKIPAELITLNPFEVMEVDLPSMQDKVEARNNLLYLKPKNVDFTPKHKKKGKTNIARKKIIKDAARKKFINQSIEAKKILKQPEEDKISKPKQSFGVLDRFISKPKVKQ